VNVKLDVLTEQYEATFKNAAELEKALASLETAGNQKGEAGNIQAQMAFLTGYLKKVEQELLALEKEKLALEKKTGAWAPPAAPEKKAKKKVKQGAPTAGT